MGLKCWFILTPALESLPIFNQPFEIGQQSPLGLTFRFWIMIGVLSTVTGGSCVRIRAAEVRSCFDDPFGEYPSGHGLSESREEPPGAAVDFGARQTHFVGVLISGLLPSLTGSTAVQVHQAQAVALQVADSTSATPCDAARVFHIRATQAARKQSPVEFCG